MTLPFIQRLLFKIILAFLFELACRPIKRIYILIIWNVQTLAAGQKNFCQPAMYCPLNYRIFTNCPHKNDMRIYEEILPGTKQNFRYKSRNLKHDVRSFPKNRRKDTPKAKKMTKRKSLVKYTEKSANSHVDSSLYINLNHAPGNLILQKYNRYGNAATVKCSFKACSHKIGMKVLERISTPCKIKYRRNIII